MIEKKNPKLSYSTHKDRTQQYSKDYGGAESKDGGAGTNGFNKIFHFFGSVQGNGFLHQLNLLGLIFWASEKPN